MSNVETLICSVGDHEWEREVKRGQKPSLCPEHRAEADEAKAAERKQAAGLDRVERWEARIAEDRERYYHLLEDRPGDEPLLKLEGLDREILSGRRSPDDVDYLFDTRDMILRRVKKAKA